MVQMLESASSVGDDHSVKNFKYPLKIILSFVHPLMDNDLFTVHCFQIYYISSYVHFQLILLQIIMERFKRHVLVDPTSTMRATQRPQCSPYICMCLKQ